MYTDCLCYYVLLLLCVCVCCVPLTEFVFLCCCCCCVCVFRFWQMYRERQEVFLPTVRLLQQLVAAHRPTKVRGGTYDVMFSLLMPSKKSRKKRKSIKGVTTKNIPGLYADGVMIACQSSEVLAFYASKVDAFVMFSSQPSASAHHGKFLFPMYRLRRCLDRYF